MGRGSGAQPVLLARQVAERIGRPIAVRLVSAGLDSTYRVVLADRSVVAVRIGGTMPIRRPTALQLEAAWIRSLVGGEVDVPFVLAPADDAGPLVIEDGDGCERGCHVVSWLPGRKAGARCTATQAAALGAAAAHLHLAGQAWAPPPGAWAKEWDGRKVGGGLGPGLVAVADEDEVRVVRQLIELSEQAHEDLGSTDWQIINADLGLHNTVWHRGRPGIFDFNDLGWGRTGFDLARLLHGLRRRPCGDALVEATLDGYRSVSDLPESFVRYGALYEQAAGVFLADYLAGKVAERGPSAERAVHELLAAAAGFVRADGARTLVCHIGGAATVGA